MFHTFVSMHGNDTKYKTFTLPPGYNFRYTLEYLIGRKVLDSNMDLPEVAKDVAMLMACTVRMVRNYRKELIGSKRAELSEERLRKLANYFDVQPKQLITENILPIDKEVLLDSKAVV